MQWEAPKENIRINTKSLEDSEGEECVLPTGTAHDNNCRLEQSVLVPHSRQSRCGRI